MFLWLYPEAGDSFLSLNSDKDIIPHRGIRPPVQGGRILFQEQVFYMKMFKDSGAAAVAAEGKDISCGDVVSRCRDYAKIIAPELVTPAADGIGVLVPRARLRPRRLFTDSPSSRYIR